MTDHVAELDEFGRHWAAAEVAGDVVTSALDWRHTQVRVFGDCAIVVGIHDLACIQMSPITAPPTPGR